MNETNLTAVIKDIRIKNKVALAIALFWPIAFILALLKAEILILPLAFIAFYPKIALCVALIGVVASWSGFRLRNTSAIIAMIINIIACALLLVFIFGMEGNFVG